MIRALLSTAAACSLAWSGAALAQSDEASGGQIVVEGQREQIRTEIKRLLEVDQAQLARFEEEFCPVVVGFPGEWTRILENLIAANAREAGLEVEDRPCTPTAVVIFSYDPDQLMPTLREKHLYLFAGMTPTELDRLIDKKRTTYGWRTVDMRDRFGQFLTQDLTSTPTVNNAAATRLYQNVRFDIVRSFIVIDLEKTPGMTLQQLADFATLNLMLDLKVDGADTVRSDTILSLFDGSDPTAKPARMSVFEQRMLKGFYAQRANNELANRQIGRIATEMKKAEAPED